MVVLVRTNKLYAMSWILLGNSVIKWGSSIKSVPVPVSAEVTNDDPDKVIITFDQALNETSIPATTDFTLVGKTVSLVNISGVTVILTVTVQYQINDSIQVTYTKPGANFICSLVGNLEVDSFTDQIVINNITHPILLDDSDTVGWYDFAEGVTKDESNLVSAWADKSIAANNLSKQPTYKTNPTYSEQGLIFNSITTTDQLATLEFGLEQPYTVYIVVNQVTWSADKCIISAAANSYNGIIGQKNGGNSPELVLYAGGISCTNANLAVGSWGIINAIFDGSNSILRIDETNDITGDPGVGDPLGIRIGGNLGVNKGAYFIVKEIIFRKISDTPVNRSLIRTYLKSKYSI